MKNRIRTISRLASLCICLLLVSCGVSSKTYTREGLYGKLYTEKPTTILVMPPINKTNHVDAKSYFYSSIMAPLSERGYYVFSPYLSLDLLQQESAADAELFIGGSLKPFAQVFHADAVLFTTIKRWEKNSLSSIITVEAEYDLRSARTGETLFRRNAAVSVDCSVTSDGGIFGLIVNAVSTAVTDKIVAARKLNYFILKDMPVGIYSPDYGKDREVSVDARNISGVLVR